MIVAEVVLKNGRFIRGVQESQGMSASRLATLLCDFMANSPEGNIQLDVEDDGGTMIIPVSEISTLTLKEKIV